MGTTDGALADSETRWAMVRSGAVAVAMFAVGVVVGVSGFLRIVDAVGHRDDLVRDGRAASALVIEVGHPFPGTSRVTFAYDGPEGRQRHTMVAFTDYRRGQKVTAYLSTTDPTDATLAGETPLSGAGWLVAGCSLLVGLVLVPLGIRRCLRAARTWSIVRVDPWTPWTMVAVYPSRRRLAVIADGETEEHLVRVDRWAAKALGRLERRSPLYLAGQGRRFVLSPTEGRRRVALGHMDEPIERFTLVGAGARQDRFDPDPEEPPADEVF